LVLPWRGEFGVAGTHRDGLVMLAHPPSQVDATRMKEVYVHSDSMRVGHAKSLLEAEGMTCFIQNDLSHNLVGGSLVGPLKLFDPVLCVADEADYARALELIQDWDRRLSESTPGADWTCPNCGQSVPGNFQECWSCQQSKFDAQPKADSV